MNIKRLICFILAVLFSLTPALYGVSSYAITNEEIVYNFLKANFPFNDAQICGVLAGIYGESRFIPTAYCIDVDGLPSYGLCQWHVTRLDKLKQYCSDNGLDYTTIEGQLTFLKYELETSEKAAYSQMLGIPNTADGAYIAGYNWCRYYGRGYSSLYESRGNIAKTMFWPKYGGTPDEPLYSVIREGLYYIRNNSTGKYITVPSHEQNNGADVAVDKLKGNDYFKILITKSVGGYLLKPVFTTGPVVNIYANIVQSGKNVTLYEPTGSMSQEWYFDYTENGYIIRSVQVPDVVMDLAGNSVKVITYSEADSQLWSLVPVSLPEAVVPTVVAGKSGELTSVSWEGVDFADSYRITIKDVGRGKQIVSTDISSTGYSVALQDGSYTVRIDSMNTPLSEIGAYITQGNTVSFTVEKSHVHDFSGRHETISEPTCAAPGSERIYCADPACGEYIISELPTTEHSFVFDFVAPTVDCEGRISKVCTACGYSVVQTVIPAHAENDPLLSASDVVTLPGVTVNVPVTLKNPGNIVYSSFNVDYNSDVMSLVEVSSDDERVRELTQTENGVLFTLSASGDGDVVINFKFYVKSTASGKFDIIPSYGMSSFSTSSGDCVYPAAVTGSVTVVDKIDYYGDANSDGSVDIKDILILRKFISGADVEIDMNLADVDGDGAVGFRDILYIRRYIAGVISKFPVE